MKPTKVILIPGNGGSTPKDNWFPYLEKELSKLSLTVINKQFPDSVLARQEFWLPFIKELGADENTILIGHSSGAIAALRFTEKNKVLGTILVGAYYSDLGDENEKKSGYFLTPWDWQSIQNNQRWIIQFASVDDPFIPIEEARMVNKNLQTDYCEYKDKQHFNNGSEFPEIVEFLKQKLM